MFVAVSTNINHVRFAWNATRKRAKVTTNPTKISVEVLLEIGAVKM